MKLDDLRKLSAHIARNDGVANEDLLLQHLLQLGFDPDNLYQELEMSSPYVQAHRDISYSNANVQLHSHTFYEVLFCRNTCGAEYLVGSERYRLQKGDIVFVPPGVSHRPLLPESIPEPYIRDILWFSPEFVNLMERTFPNQHNPEKHYPSLLRTAGTRWEDLGQQLHTAVEESEQQRPGWDTLVMGLAMTFMTQLKRAFQEGYAQPMKAEAPGLLDKAMAYIEANLTRKITLEDIARHLYVSKSTITQTFRNKMGVSVYRCVTQRRLIAAKARIEQGEALEDVGRQVGFSDYSGFYRAFRQEYGISPRQYKLMQKHAPIPRE